MRLSIPYLKMRDGRPRWEPGPGLRAKGFKGRDLKNQNGGWLTEAEAIAVARELNREVAEWRERGAPLRRPRQARKVPQSIDALISAYQASPKWLRLRDSTRNDYEHKLGIVRQRFGVRPVAALAKPHLYAWWEELTRDRGAAMANGTIAVLRLLLSHATRIGWIEVNPAMGLAIDGIAPRCVVWTPAECELMVATADAMGLHSVADAIVIALHTGQREGDVLALELPQIEGGRAAFRQSKRGARVSVPMSPQLEARLAAIRNRRSAASGVINLADARVVILTERGQPYRDRWQFNKAFRRVRARVAGTLQSAADKQFLDFRDTAITRLALAGCTVAEIRAITGHSMQTIHAVLAHYLALDDRMADAAIDRLRQWMDREGIAI